MKLTSVAKSLVFSPPFPSSLNISIKFWKSFFWKTTRFADFCPNNQHLPGATFACCDCFSWYCVFISPTIFCYATHLRRKQISILFFTFDSFPKLLSLSWEFSLSLSLKKQQFHGFWVQRMWCVWRSVGAYSFSCPLFLLERSRGQQL